MFSFYDLLNQTAKKVYSDEHQEQIHKARAAKPAAANRQNIPAHIGNLRNAVDFIVLPNTTALAVVDGMVPYVKDDPMLLVPIHRIGTILTLSQSCTKTELCPV